MKNYSKGWHDLNTAKMTLEHKIMMIMLPVILIITYYFESM